MTVNVGVSAAAFFDYLPSVPEAKRQSDSTRRLRVISLSCRKGTWDGPEPLEPVFGHGLDVFSHTAFPAGISKDNGRMRQRAGETSC